MQNKIFEAMGYMGLALTIAGQVVCGPAYILAQFAWLVANGLFLVKAIKQRAGKAEIVRNSVMGGLTIGLIVAYYL